MANETSNTVDSQTTEAPDNASIELYTGISQSIFALGPQGLRDFADSWESKAETLTGEEVSEKIASIESERDSADSEYGKQLETIGFSDLDAVQNLMLERARTMVAYQEKIDLARMLPLSKSFESVAKKILNFTPRTKHGNSSSGNVSPDNVYKVEYHGATNFFLPMSEEVIHVCKSDGEHSDLYHRVTKEEYPDFLPRSETAIQRLHCVYHGARTDKVMEPAKRLKKAQEAYTKIGKFDAAWAKEAGLKTHNTNGSNNLTVLEITPKDWLESNPIQSDDSEESSNE